MAGRQLQLARRENFFSDPFFSDFMNLDDDDFTKKLASFKERSVALGGSRQEAAHNLQVLKGHSCMQQCVQKLK